MKVHLNKRFMRLAILGAVFLFALYLLFLVRGILFPFVLAIIIAYILNPAVELLEHYRFSRSAALSVVYLVGILLVFVAFVYGIPVIVRELNNLAGDLPELAVRIQEFFARVYEKFRRIPLPSGITEVVNDNVTNLENILVNGIRSTVDTILGFFSQLGSILLAPILAFYLLKDWDFFGRKIQTIFPVSYVGEFFSLWEDVDRVLMGFIRGHLFVAVIVGVLTGLGLSLVGMDYVVLLSVISAVTDLIPYFGPIIGAVPAVTLAFLQSESMALRVLLVMIVVQQIESNLITPAVLGDSVGLHPVAIVFALLAGGALFGVVGLLLAVPAAGIARIIIGHVYSNLVS